VKIFERIDHKSILACLVVATAFLGVGCEWIGEKMSSGGPGITGDQLAATSAVCVKDKECDKSRGENCKVYGNKVVFPHIRGGGIQYFNHPPQFGKLLPATIEFTFNLMRSRSRIVSVPVPKSFRV